MSAQPLPLNSAGVSIRTSKGSYATVAMVLSRIIVITICLCLYAIPTSASTHAHAPRQKHHGVRHPLSNHSSTTHERSHILSSSSPHNHYTASAIHVLPPSPDDTPKECPVNTTLYASCGAERYCAKLPGKTTTTNNEEDVEPPNDYYCLHKTLWFPTLTARDFLAFVLAGTCCFLAAMAGIGGGGLILPILLLCCNFTPKEASVLSNTAVFCNTLGQFCINNSNGGGGSDNTTTNNINDKRKLVILATVLMIMPPVIAGGSVAITLEGMVPSTVILILALCTLLLASTKTYFKAQKMRKAEQQQAQHEQEWVIDTSPPPPPRSNLLTRFNQEEEGESRGQEAGVPISRHDEDGLMMASALEFGSVTAGGNLDNTNTNVGSPRSKGSTDLLDQNDQHNNGIMEETFFGSIRYLNKDSNSSILIIDETSIAASSQRSHQGAAETSDTLRRRSKDSSADDNNCDTLDNAEQQQSAAPSPDEEDHSSRRVFVHSYRIFNASHHLAALIGGFWVLDAAAFLLLHTGTLVPKCSTIFFILVCAPALVALVFVGLGRSRLRAILQGSSTPDYSDTERRPLIVSSSFGSQDEGDNDEEDEEEAYEPVPTLDESPQSATAGQQQQQQRSGVMAEANESRMDSNWVLWIPLVSAVAGMVKGSPAPGQDSTTSSRRRSISAPLLLSRSSSIDDDEEEEDDAEDRAHDDNLRSLLACWLPWICILIGLLSALLGIGGGELLGPILLLLLQMDPQESSATTAIMSMMNSGTNLLHYIVADMMIAPGYAINLGLVGLVGGSGGRLWAMSMAQNGRPSVIAMSLCGVLSLATALVAWELATTPTSFARSGGVC